MDSILNTVKKALGIDPEYTSFDDRLIPHINTVFQSLCQLGVGPEKPFTIEDASSTWEDFSEDIEELAMVESYVGMKVKSIFDPAQSGVLADAEKRIVDELEWRLNVEVDPGDSK